MKMDNLFQKHGAKYICKVPDGLPELCSDISREVLRSQPTHIYEFIANYVEKLLLTRENAKVAFKLVDKIMADSESIVNFLNRCGLNFKQIAAIAPKLQNAFREYVNYTECNCAMPTTCIDEICNEESEVNVRNIIETAGVTLEAANRAARVIQRAFLKHHKQMEAGRIKEEAPWKQSLKHTIEILKEAGLSERDARKTAKSIESTYEEYYTKRKKKKSYDEKNVVNDKKNGFSQPDESIQAVAWLSMMYDDSGITGEQANQAATIIQRAFRDYQSRKNSELQRSTSTSSAVARTILENLQQRIFDKVLSREAIPRESATIEKIAKATEKLPEPRKERLNGSKLSLNIATNDVEEKTENIHTEHDVHTDD